eukprot:1156272-Pelagomonas_calceolata.AAC.9
MRRSPGPYQALLQVSRRGPDASAYKGLGRSTQDLLQEPELVRDRKPKNLCRCREGAESHREML